MLLESTKTFHLKFQYFFKDSNVKFKLLLFNLLVVLFKILKKSLCSFLINL
jgi:hypothetical protein